MNSQSWFVYMVRCSDNTLYTGITTDLERRVNEHNSTGKGARYTRSRQPVTLVYREETHSRASAASREYQIKKLNPIAKQKLLSANCQR